MFNPFKKEKIVVWHPASPGVRVTVERNWFQQKVRPSKFATLREVSMNHNKGTSR